MPTCEICDVPGAYLPDRQGHCTGCHLTWTGHAVCHCAKCHLTFGSITGFDAHLTSPDEDFRHRTVEELRELGYTPNVKGYYTDQRRLSRMTQGRVPQG